MTNRRIAGGGITRFRGLAWAPALALALAGASPAVAQASGESGMVSRPVVQALPPSSVADLESALQRLAANPRDVGALIAAGSASLEVGDMDAAIGFFSRAGELSPSDPRPKIGLGAALVRSENPYDALLMFEEAERYGASSDLLAGDRGLAWDLVGDNRQAQTFYRQALSHGADDEVTRRLALSLAMSGDAREAQKLLQPLLDRGDPAAQRTQAFVLAISGETREATEIARQAMPRDLADSISPYLRYMPRLTPAQQAAAANFGHFPTTAEIGKDDPRIAKYNKDNGTKRVARGADSSLVPAGEPLGGTKKLSRREQREAERRRAEEERARQAAAKLAAKKQAETAQAEAAAKARPARPAQVAAARKPGIAEAAKAPASSPLPASTPSQSALASVRATQEAPRPSVSLAAPAPATQAAPGFTLPPQASRSEPGAAQIASFDPAGAGTPPQAPAGGGELPPLAQQPEPLPGTQPAPPPAPAPAPAATPPAPTPPAAPAPAPQAPLSVADAFADLSLKPGGPVVPAGAVDITKIKPRREEPPRPRAEPSPPPKPVEPSRAWVQVATGRDTDALAFDWRRITRGAPELFKGRKAYIAAWGQTNRMVTGPFDSAKAAQDFVTRLKAAGVDSFTFTSAEGEAVEPLAGDK